MTTRAKLSIVALFSCCAMIGMGFASWTISQDPAGISAEVSGTVSAESVLSCSAPGITAPHYSSMGFTSGENGFTSFSYTGTMSVEYTITSGGYVGNADLTVKLGYDSNFPTDSAQNIFADAKSDFLTAKAQVGTMSESGVTGTTDNNLYIVTVPVKFADGTEEIKVKITYTFDFTKGGADAATNFTQYFYNVFVKDGTLTGAQFTFNATLAAEEVTP